MDEIKQGLCFLNTSTITLTGQHDKLGMTITAYKYKKMSYFRYFPKYSNV